MNRGLDFKSNSNFTSSERMRPLWGSLWAIGEVLVLKSSSGKASMGTDLVDVWNDEAQGDSASLLILVALPVFWLRLSRKRESTFFLG